jgi:hypothetical protein
MVDNNSVRLKQFTTNVIGLKSKSQIANNIQIRMSNDQNILATYLLYDGSIACLEI